MIFLLTSNPEVAVKNTTIIRVPELFAKREMSPIAYSTFSNYIRKKYDLDIIHGNGYTVMDDVTTVHFLRKAFEHRTSESIRQANFPRSEHVFEEIAVKSSRRLIAPSGMVKEDLVKLYGVREDKISIIHNGVDVNEFTVPSSEVKAKARCIMGLNDESVCVGFVGPAGSKGLGRLIYSLPRVKNRVRVLAVNVNETEQSRYGHMAQKLGVSEIVTLIPRFSDMPLFYKAIDIFALPTRYDTFSMSSLEAMASGLPVIASSNAGISEIIEDGRNGFVLHDAKDTNSLAELIDLLSCSNALRKEIGVRARITAESQTWDKAAVRVIGVYRTLLQR